MKQSPQLPPKDTTPEERRLATGRGITVRALRDGFAGGQRIRKGRTFVIRSHKEFSDKWMERVDGNPVDDVTLARERRVQEQARAKGSAPAASAAAAIEQAVKAGTNVADTDVI